MNSHSRLYLILSLLVICSLVFFAAAPVQAITSKEIETRQRELQEIEKKRQDEKSALEKRLNREAALKDELKRLESELHYLQIEQERLTDEITLTKEEIALAEEELAAAEEELQKQEDLLKLRLRAIQQHGLVSYLEVLFDSSSFTDFLTRLHNLSIIAANDLRLIEEIQAERDMIQAWKEELESKRAELENKYQKIIENQVKIEELVNYREAMVISLQQEISINLKVIQDLEEEAQRLDALIRRLIAESTSHFSGLEGPLLWPIEPPTWISSGYGWRRDPFSGAQAWHGGVDMAPHHGAANYIIAAAEGKVIYSGWNGGYGNCIMIDHGGGTVTLYAHMSSLLVQVGEIVYQGQRIARAGTTGYSTGVHLHFEVREFNKPAVRSYPGGGADHRYNPMTYF